MFGYIGRSSLLVTLFSLVLVLTIPGCVELDTSHGESSAAIITYNSITTGEELANAISANPQALALLTSDPLESSAVQTNLSDQLQDPWAQKFMSYLVGCALEPAHTVTVSDPISGDPIIWKGDVGLCPEWHGSAIDDDSKCQELVSACLLARNNPLGLQVQLDLRGTTSSNQSLGAEPGYTVKEGAFYGNILDSGSMTSDLTVTVDSQGQVVYTGCHSEGCQNVVVYEASEPLDERDNGHAEFLSLFEGLVDRFHLYNRAYSCAAPTWHDADAYHNNRLCAGAAGVQICAAKSVGRCWSNQGADKCSQQDVLPVTGDEDYGNCTGDQSSSWKHVITVFLDHACAIVSDEEACRAVR